MIMTMLRLKVISGALAVLWFVACGSQWTDRNSVQWTNTNNTYGSREMAASMALSGELKQVKAMILADMIGSSNLKIKRDMDNKREKGSTPWLVDLIWATAARLGYGNVFIDENYLVGGDDHFSFLRRPSWRLLPLPDYARVRFRDCAGRI